MGDKSYNYDAFNEKGLNLFISHDRPINVGEYFENFGIIYKVEKVLHRIGSFQATLFVTKCDTF